MSEEDEKYKLLALRCQAVQVENEEIARQVVTTKRNLCKARRLRMRLLQKLDSIGDSWRQGQVKGIPLSHPKFNKGGFSNLDKPSFQPTLANLPSTNHSPNELLSSVLNNNSNTNNNTSSEEDFNSSPSDSNLVSSLSSITMPLTIPVSSDSTFSEHDLMNSCLTLHHDTTMITTNTPTTSQSSSN